MQAIYSEGIEDPRQAAAAYDTSGVPVPPSPSGFQMLGQVEGTSTSNAYLAEQERERQRLLTEKQRADAEQAAIRFGGLQKYRSLIAGGATPQEAMRLAGTEMLFNHPSALAVHSRSLQEKSPFTPSVKNIDGRNYENLREGVWTPQKNATAAKEVMPPDLKMRQDLLREELKRTTSGPLGVAADPKVVADLERKLMEGSTNWMGKAEAPQVSTAPTDDMVPVTSPDGSPGKVPRSKLDAAKKAGYKVR